MALNGQTHKILRLGVSAGFDEDRYALMMPTDRSQVKRGKPSLLGKVWGETCSVTATQ